MPRLSGGLHLPRLSGALHPERLSRRLHPSRLSRALHGPHDSRGGYTPHRNPRDLRRGGKSAGKRRATRGPRRTVPRHDPGGAAASPCAGRARARGVNATQRRCEAAFRPCWARGLARAHGGRGEGLERLRMAHAARTLRGRAGGRKDGHGWRWRAAASQRRGAQQGARMRSRRKTAPGR